MHHSDLPPKLIGTCSQCQTPLWNSGTLYVDRPGFRTAFMLADGSTMDLTLCDACDSAPNMDYLWRRVCAAWLMGKNVKPADRALVAKQIRDNFILARLFALRWKQVEGALKWLKT